MNFEEYIDTVSGKVLEKRTLLRYSGYSWRIEYEEYFLGNKLHREDGPAQIWYNKNGNVESEFSFYYLNGEEIKNKSRVEETINKKIIEEKSVKEKEFIQTKTRKIFIIDD